MAFPTPEEWLAQKRQGALTYLTPDLPIEMAPQNVVQSSFPSPEEWLARKKVEDMTATGLIKNIAQDAVNKVGQWAEGAKAGAEEIGRAAQHMPVSMSSAEMPGGAGLTPPDEAAIEYNQQAVGNFMNETVKPVAYTAALVPGANAAVALPFLANDIVNMAREKGVGETAKEFSGVGPVERALEKPGEYAQRFYKEPLTTASEFIPAILLGKGAAGIIRKGARSGETTGRDMRTEHPVDPITQIRYESDLVTNDPVTGVTRFKTPEEWLAEKNANTNGDAKPPVAVPSQEQKTGEQILEDAPSRGIEEGGPEPGKVINIPVLQKAMDNAINKGDYEAAANIAEQMGQPRVAEGIRSFSEKQKAAMMPPEGETKIPSPLSEKVSKIVDETFADKDLQVMVPLGKPSARAIEVAKSGLGLDISDFTHEISTKDLRHALKEHGNPEVEAARRNPQEAITVDDLRKIGDVLHNPDSVSWGRRLTEGSNKPGSIIWSKRVNGNIIYVETIYPKKGILRTKSLWKTPSVDPNAQNPAAGVHTSRTGQAPNPSDNSLTSSTSNISEVAATVKGEQNALPFTQNTAGATTLDTVTRRQIIDDINKMVATRTGRLGMRGALGVFKISPEVIRSGEYGDMQVLSHEVGHYLDKKLKLSLPAFDNELIAAADKQWGNNPTYQKYSLADKRAEGVAEFARQYMVEPDAAKSNFPLYSAEFERVLNNNPEIKSAVEGIQSKIQTWYGQSPEARARGGMSFGYETPKDPIFQRAKDKWYSFYEKWVDDKVGMAKATADIEKAIGKKLEMADNPYLQARIAQSSAVARAQLLTEGKDPAQVARVMNKVYGMVIEKGVTIREILEPLGDKSLSVKYPNYLKNGNFRDWRESFDTYLAARRQLELQRIYPKYKGSMSPGNALLMVQRAPAEFTPLAEKFYQYHDNMMRIAQKTGMISQNTYNTLRTKYKEYAPMAREFTDAATMEKAFGVGKGYGNIGNPLKSITEYGATEAVKSPLESTIRNTYALLSIAERNKVAQTFVKLADYPGIGRIIEKDIPGGSNAKESIFTVMIDGKKKSFQTTPEVYRAIMSMGMDSANFVSSIFGNPVLSMPAKLLRAGATLTPDFVIRNLMRDTVSATIFSRHGFIPIFDTARGLAHMWKNTELYQEYKASGAQMATMVALDRNNINQSIGKLMRESTLQKVNPIEWLRRFSEAAETATRMGEFALARKAGKSIEEAGLAAKDITIDFSRHGSLGKEINKGAAFFNAAIQGGDRLARAFREDPIGFNTKAFYTIMLPSYGLWLINHDQDWYKEMPEQQKNAAWVFKAGDTIYRIPKPFEPGIFYGSGIERILDYQLSKEPKIISEWAKSARDAFLPNFFPTVAVPIIEWMNNYSFFRERQIVPEREKNLHDWRQFGPYTSETAKFIGKAINQSPRKIDNTIRGYTGSMGSTGLALIDLAAGKYENLPTQKMENLPGFRAVMGAPFQNPQSVQAFYEKLSEMEKDYEDRGKNRNPPKELRDMRDSEMKIRDLNKKEREVLGGNLSPAEKHLQLDLINRKRLEVAKKALGRG